MLPGTIGVGISSFVSDPKHLCLSIDPSGLAGCRVLLSCFDLPNREGPPNKPRPRDRSWKEEEKESPRRLLSGNLVVAVHCN